MSTGSDSPPSRTPTNHHPPHPSNPHPLIYDTHDIPGSVQQFQLATNFNHTVVLYSTYSASLVWLGTVSWVLYFEFVFLEIQDVLIGTGFANLITYVRR